jgi:hypothetical protein|tara:strand:- start:859 stop:1056 length:198 start_codon:yes stop_codon:yes gene_type:complete
MTNPPFDLIEVGDLVKVTMSSYGRIEIGLVIAFNGAFLDVLFFDGHIHKAHPVFIQKIKQNNKSS